MGICRMGICRMGICRLTKRKGDVLWVMVGLVKVKMLVGYLVSKALRIRFGRDLY